MEETTYIQFKAPKTAQIPQPDGILKRTLEKALVRILTFLIPKGNPDFDDKIDLVENWLVEIDNGTGIPEREIGLDKNGKVILIMPFKNNYGYWTDNNLLLDDFKNHFTISEISGESFENYWNLFKNATDFATELTDYQTLSTGADGGHIYIKTKILYNGQERDLVIYFSHKSDERKIKAMNKIKIRGRICDEGLNQSLSMYETELLNR